MTTILPVGSSRSAYLVTPPRVEQDLVPWWDLNSHALPATEFDGLRRGKSGSSSSNAVIHHHGKTITLIHAEFEFVWAVLLEVRVKGMGSRHQNEHQTPTRGLREEITAEHEPVPVLNVHGLSLAGPPLTQRTSALVRDRTQSLSCLRQSGSWREGNMKASGLV